MASKAPSVFVLMPFSAKFDSVYKLGIKAACEQCGAVAERVDEQIFTESIVERIYGQIEKADLLIADMSNRNPNVFYEVGYAHAKKRNVVLLTRKAKDIPFDLKAYPHVIYGDDISLLKTELARRIRFFLKEQKAGRTAVEPTVLVYNNGRPISPNDEVLIDFRTFPAYGRPGMVLDFHVPDVENLGAVKQKFGIITSDFITQLLDGENASRTTLPDGRCLYQSRLMKLNLLPGEWFKYDFTVNFQNHVVDRLESFSVRLFTAFGPVDVPFKVRMLGVSPSLPKDSVRRPNAAFLKPVSADAALGAIVGFEPMPRTDLTKKLWEYIKKNELQDKKVRTQINADEKLKRVTDGRDNISMFELTKMVSAHLVKG